MININISQDMHNCLVAIAYIYRNWDFFRSSLRRCSVKKGVLNNVANFT